MTDESRDSAWVVRADEPDFPDSVIEAASAGQSSLGAKLAQLRARREPFPDGSVPAAADRWIADGGRQPRSRSTPDGSDESGNG